MRLPTRLLGACAALVLAGTAATAATAATATGTGTTSVTGTSGRASAALARAATPGWSKHTLHLVVHIGPRHAQRCVLVADLYRPDGATKAHPAPAVLTTNGFGGSKNDQAGQAKRLAARGYVVLAYSGVGFGGSSCRIELDSFAWDGRAAAQLVTFLAGGSKATDGTRVTYVAHDRRDHRGRHRRWDPVVGMIGGSYGGGVQLAAAAVDPRIDALVPVITWNDLGYALAPNNAGLSGSDLSSAVPGITKAGGSTTFGPGWLNLLWFSGITTQPTKPLPPSTCPNFDQSMCAIHDHLVSSGYPSAAALRKFRTTSISSRIDRLRIPVLLEQGENDSLFNLQQAVATYRALKKQHTPVKMVWQSWGHSGGTNSGAERRFLNHLNDAWFRHFLKHRGARPAMDFSFFRPWVADPAHPYAGAPAYPIGSARRLYLSGAHGLVPTAGKVTNGSAPFTTPGVGDPESLTQNVDAGHIGTMNDVTVADPPGTAASFQTAPLTRATDVVGVPHVTLHIASPSAGLTTKPTGTLGLFFRVEDVAPDGTVTLPAGLISAARFPTSDAGGDVTVALPGIVHRFPQGHRIRLVVAGSDTAYALPNPAVSVTVSTTTAHPGVLTLPVATRKDYTVLR